MKGGCCAMLLKLMLVVLNFVLGVTSGNFMLTIAHTNDIHARFEQVSKYGGPCSEKDARNQKCYGGVARMQTKIKEIRKSDENVLFLDAGDQFQGTLWFYIYKGNITADFMNLLNYDAMALGNHEFDIGVSGLLPFLMQAKFPILSCNIDVTLEPSLRGQIQPYHLFNVSGKTVAVIGYTTSETPDLSSSEEVIFHEEVESVRKQVEILKRKGVDIFIGLGHAGFYHDLELARLIPDLDIVVGGHTNTFLYNGSSPTSTEQQTDHYPTVVHHGDGSQTLVVQAYAFGKYMGYLQVTFDDLGRITTYNGNPILLDSTVEQDADMLKLVEVGRSVVNEYNLVVVGQSIVLLNGSRACRLLECNMGNMITDGLYERYLASETPAHAAIINSGAIRASLDAGDITLGDIRTVQPFHNTIDVIETRGSHIRDILEHSVSGYNRQGADHGKFLQVSGVRVLYDASAPDNNKILNVCITDHMTKSYRPLVNDDIYRVVVPSFLVRGGDGYRILPQAIEHFIYETLDVDVTRDYIRDNTPVQPEVEGRIQFLSDIQSADDWSCSNHGNASYIFTYFRNYVLFILVYFHLFLL